MSSESVNERNILSLAEHLKRVDTASLVNAEKCTHLENIILQMSGRLQQLEQQISILRIKSMGTGPTT